MDRPWNNPRKDQSKDTNLKRGKVVDELEAALYGQAQKFQNWMAKENKSISEINK